MKKIAEKDSDMSSRRNFLKKVGAGVGALSVTGIAGASIMKNSTTAKSGKMIKLLSPDGKLVDDFRIVEAERQIHVLNAPSPAATASIAIGRHVARLALARIGA